MSKLDVAGQKEELLSVGTKVKELTGYDVRKPSENPALYMAYLIMQDIEMEKSETYALLHETK